MFLRFVPDALDAFVTISSRLNSTELVRVPGDLTDSDDFLAMSFLVFPVCVAVAFQFCWINGRNSQKNRQPKLTVKITVYLCEYPVN